MANVWYPLGLENIGLKKVNLDTDDIRVMLVESSYTPNAADQFISDMGAVDNGRSATLANTSLAPGGIFDADDTSIVATAAVACNALVIFLHTGNDATALLLLYLDSPTAGLPFTPAAGQPLSIAWNNGANKIARL